MILGVKLFAILFTFKALIRSTTQDHAKNDNNNKKVKIVVFVSSPKKNNKINSKKYNILASKDHLKKIKN